MRARPLHVLVFAAGLAGPGVLTDAAGQGWSTDVFAGQVVFNPASINTGTNNLIGSLRYDTSREGWVYGTAAAPLGSNASRWGGAGAGGRFSPPGSHLGRPTVGVELDAHAFAFRDALASQSGRGGVVGVLSFASVSSGAARFEARGGWRGQSLEFTGVTQTRGILEAGARAIYQSPVRLQADARWVHAPEGTYPFVGGSLQYARSPVTLWARAGRWLSADLAEASWGGGLSVAAGARAAVWVMVQHDAPDPLYWNAPRRAWSVGVTQRLGGIRAASQSAPGVDAGGVVIRVPVSDVPEGALQVAGSFNGWTPVPMRREGGEWVVRVPLTAGVYEYAFRSAAGTWFVPASLASRRDDGMGGHVAVLVVL